jgi:anti-sigma factor RsiW
MKNCLEREQLFAYALEMLEGQEKLEMQRHVAECAICRKALEEYRQLDGVLDGWQPLQPSPWFDARVRSAVARAEESFASPWARFLAGLGWSRRMAPALVAMMVLVVSAVIVERRPNLLPRSVTYITDRANDGSAANALSQLSPAELAGGRAVGAATLDDYDMLANFEVLSELPKPEGKVAD